MLLVLPLASAPKKGEKNHHVVLMEEAEKEFEDDEDVSFDTDDEFEDEDIGELPGSDEPEENEDVGELQVTWGRP